MFVDVHNDFDIHSSDTVSMLALVSMSIYSCCDSQVHKRMSVRRCTGRVVVAFCRRIIIPVHWSVYGCCTDEDTSSDVGVAAGALSTHEECDLLGSRSADVEKSG